MRIAKCNAYSKVLTGEKVMGAMGAGNVRGLSSGQRRELWQRWKDGQSLSEIGRALGKNVSSVHSVLRAAGGIAPVARTRRAGALSLAEREEISRGLAAGRPLSEIASALRRAPSTVGREVHRNGGRSQYRASAAESQACQRARRPKQCRLALHRKLARVVAAKLRNEWAPQQISGWLKMEYAGDAAMQVSHETIYKSLFIQARGVLKQSLVAHLRSRRLMRRGRTASPKRQRRGQITDAISISERPAAVEDRAIPGHWEGDLLCGTHNSYIATLVERHSRFVLLVRVPGKDSAGVVDALVRKVKTLPKSVLKSLTWDRGLEMAEHKQFSIATDVAVYFCDPKSPWQRGSNENTNGLLRQYLPKGTDLSPYSQAQLDAIALKLNTRPRKTLAFRTPAFMLNTALH
jgi:IS30 family transposase